MRNINGSSQDCSISIANAMEILQSRTKPLICPLNSLYRAWWICSYSTMSTVSQLGPYYTQYMVGSAVLSIPRDQADRKWDATLTHEVQKQGRYSKYRRGKVFMVISVTENLIGDKSTIDPMKAWYCHQAITWSHIALNVGPCIASVGRIASRNNPI